MNEIINIGLGFLDLKTNSLNVNIMLLTISILLVLNFFNVFRFSNILTVLFKLPGTFFHELAHFFVGIVTFAKPVNFSLIPKFQDKSITMGSVSFINLNFFNTALISLAPFLLVPLSFYLFYIFSISLSTSEFDYFSILYGYLVFNTFSSSLPSSQDYRVALSNKAGILFYIGVLIFLFLYLEDKIKI